MLTFRSRATGALLGQVVGDALGSQLEFMSAASIEKRSLQRLATDMLGSPVWNTLAGQITDDSEMAIAALSSIARRGGYDKAAARMSYGDWLRSKPFDVGITVGGAIRSGSPSRTSRSNGSMMRCSTIAVWGTSVSGREAVTALAEDALITHLDPVVVGSTVLYGLAIRHAILTGADPHATFAYVQRLAEVLNVHETVREYIRRAEHGRPHDTDEGYQTGYCMVAFQHALYSLISGETFAEALTNTILRGGDTDTNAAIVGALLGSVLGQDAIPSDWLGYALTCAPGEGTPQPRPATYHVPTMMSLAEPFIAEVERAA